MWLPYRIRNIEVTPPLVLSPMSGVTTSAFRRLIRELNPGAVGVLISEFISVEAMTRKVPRTLEMMHFDPSERPFGIQIFGYDPQRMRDAALMCQDKGVDFVDINCGCPAPKVVRKGGGCELMRQPEHLAKILQQVRAALTIPLTIKFRAGWDESSKNAVQIARIAEEEGVDALAVHGRTRAQLYRGEADWDLVAEVAQSVKVPVLGSGDVTSHEKAIARMKSGIKGIYIGRGALQNPFVFTEIATGERRETRDPMLLLGVIERYRELLSLQFSARASIGKLKQLVSQMARGQPWRRDLCRAANLDEFDRLVKMIRDYGGRWPTTELSCDDGAVRGAPSDSNIAENSSSFEEAIE